MKIPRIDGLKHLLLAAFIIVVVGGFLLRTGKYAPLRESQGPNGCDMASRQCPDGSIVVRSGPSCEFAACPSTASVTLPQDVVLGVGAVGRVGDLAITFNRFVQDSRCPIDVQCIQAGAVNINVSFSNGKQTVTKNMPSDEVPQEFGGYKISIVEIAPARKSGAEIDPRDYKITFHVSR